jgi:hypothetical protein
MPMTSTGQAYASPNHCIPSEQVGIILIDADDRHVHGVRLAEPST